MIDNDYFIILIYFNDDINDIYSGAMILLQQLLSLFVVVMKLNVQCGRLPSNDDHSATVNNARHNTPIGRICLHSKKWWFPVVPMNIKARHILREFLKEFSFSSFVIPWLSYAIRQLIYYYLLLIPSTIDAIIMRRRFAVANSDAVHVLWRNIY